MIFSATANDMIYLPYGLSYTSRWQGHPDAHYIVIDIALYDQNNHVFNFGNAPSILLHDSRSSYPGLFSEITKGNDTQSPFFSLECLSNVFKLCYEMANAHDSNLESAKFQSILQGVFYLEHNYLIDFPIGNLANMCSMSESNFRRLFYEYKGVSPLKYKNLLRLHKAENLLITGNYSVTQVSEMIRCCDIKHFSKLFKRYYGYTPSSIIPSQRNQAQLKTELREGSK